MALRLELKQIGITAAAGKSSHWRLEHGRRSLGRSPDCEWQISDPKCHISKHHCTIERERDGFLLRDQSANGTRVDGRMVFEGETARLADQSRIEIGEFGFFVQISGENGMAFDDPDQDLRLSDETLTISSILADIAPGGQTATGILGERIGDDWPSSDEIKNKSAISSRNVDIGWNGPPAIEGLAPIIPNDWNSDLETGSALEHAAATRAIVPIRQSRPVEADESEPATAEAPAINSFEDIEKVFNDLEAPPSLRPPQQLDALIRQLEEAQANTLSIFDIDAAELIGPSSAPLGRHASLSARLEDLLDRHIALNAAFERLLNETSHMLEPRILEASVDAEASRLPWQRKNYWQTYRAQFERAGKSISVREIFREAMLETAAKTGEFDKETKGRIGRAS